MNAEQIATIIQEIRNEQHPIENDATLEGYIKHAEYNLNDYAGAVIDYNKDLDARALLKNYVFYARYKRLAEFKSVYEGEYCDLQARYYKPADIQ